MVAQESGGATRSITVDYEFPEPPEAVWRALTEPGLLARWLMPGDIRPVVGHRFTLQAQPAGGWDGVIRCEVLAADEPRLLRYTWRGGAQEVDGYGHLLDTVVTWTLRSREGGGTHLRLEHAGFRSEDEFAWRALGSGWRTKQASLAEAVTAAG